MDTTTEQKIKDTLAAFLPVALTPEQYAVLMKRLGDIFSLDMEESNKPYKQKVVGLTVKDLQEYLTFIQDYIADLEKIASTEKEETKLFQLRQKEYAISELLYTNRWW